MPEGPPPLRDPARTAVLRVLAATALIPVLMLVGGRVPPPLQDQLTWGGMWLVLVIPAVSVLIGVVAIAQDQKRAGLGYLLGAVLAGVLGFGACTLSLMTMS